MHRGGKVHYLPGNKISWSPPTVAFVKALVSTVPGSDPELLTLDGWMARVVKRRDVKPASWVEKFGSGESAIGLAEWLTENTRGRETTWLFTHNAALDLVTTRLPLQLHAAGWEINDASLAAAAPWVRLSRGSRRITIADSFSWLSHTAPGLAEKLGLPPAKQAPDESNPDWQTRSARWELDVVADSMLELLDWWDKHDLGKWSISGASTGWHAMRHMPSVYKVTIDPDPARIAADRKAIYGGRRGAWLIGSRSQGPFLELDFANAYPTVAAHLPLPIRRTAAFESMELDNWRLQSERWGVLATVTVRTNVPRYPVRFAGGTLCPVGVFTTTLCGPEIREALRLGCLAEVGPGIVHQLGYATQPWGRWILEQVHNAGGDTPPAAQVAAKSWSRNVVGKWAARAYERTDWGDTPEMGWSYVEGWDNPTGTRGGMISMAGRQWWSGCVGDAEQAYPAVFAWTESYVRAALTRVIDAVGTGCVLQCDTDGLIVNERVLGTRGAGGALVAPDALTGPARTRWVLDQLAPLTDPLRLVVKRTMRTIRILGPQHVDKPGDRKFSGLPKLAREVAPDVYTYKQWPGLPYQLGAGDSGGYVRPEATVHISGPYAPGWVLSDGRVIPPECTIGRDKENRLVSWHDMTTKPKGAKLAQTQHPILAALW